MALITRSNKLWISSSSAKKKKWPGLENSPSCSARHPLLRKHKLIPNLSVSKLSGNHKYFGRKLVPLDFICSSFIIFLHSPSLLDDFQLLCIFPLLLFSSSSLFVFLLESQTIMTLQVTAGGSCWLLCRPRAADTWTPVSAACDWKVLVSLN